MNSQKPNHVIKIFKWIKDYFDEVRSRFRKKKQEQAVRDRIAKTKGTSQEEIQTNIEEKARQEESLTTTEILELAEAQTATEIQDLIVSPIKIRRRIFDLVEIEQEVTALNKKLIEVQIKKNQIEPVRFPKNYKTDNDIEELERILQKYDNKQNLTLSTSAIDKLKSRFEQFDKFLQERVLVGIYRIREVERAKEFKKFKHDIEALHVQVNKQIDQDDFQSAKLAIRKLEILLKSIQALSVRIIQGKAKEKNRIVSNLISKTVELKRKLSFRETEIEAKRQAEDLKRRQAEVERRLKAEEAKKEEERKFNEEYGIIEDNPDKNSKIASFGISGLYHMTDMSNLNNIFKFGLLSHTEAHKKGLVQRDISDNEVNDRRNSKEPKNKRKIHDYVPLYFNPRNPMLYRRRDWQDSIVILEIDYRVIYQKNSLFTNGNAASNHTIFFNDISNLDKVDLSFVLGNGYWTDYPDGKRKKCSEILVYPIIQRQYIKKVHCKNTQTMNRVREIARNSNFEVSCSLTSKLYFS